MASDIEAYLRGEAQRRPARWVWTDDGLMITADLPIIDQQGLRNFEIHSVVLDDDEVVKLRDWLIEETNDDSH